MPHRPRARRVVQHAHAACLAAAALALAGCLAQPGGHAPRHNAHRPASHAATSPDRDPPASAPAPSTTQAHANTAAPAANPTTPNVPTATGRSASRTPPNFFETLAAAGDRPVIFNATNFIAAGAPNNAPRVQLPNTHPVNFYSGWRVGLPKNRSELSQRRLTEAVAAIAADNPPGFVVINIEHIPVETARRHQRASERDIREGHRLLSRILAAAKRAMPNRTIALYDMIPPQHMRAWNPEHRLHTEFQQALERTTYTVDPRTGARTPGGLVSHVDVVCPAFYLAESRLELFRRDQAAGKPFDQNRGVRAIRDWVEHTVRAARQTGKPVVPVVWHRVHGRFGNPDDGFDDQPYVGDQAFRLILEETLEHGDAVIWWGRREAYNPRDPWHRVAQDLLTAAAKPGHAAADDTHQTAAPDHHAGSAGVE